MFQHTSLSPATGMPAIAAVAKAPLAARAPVAPVPRHAHWRAAAFSIFADDSQAQGPFSLWPRPDAGAKAAAAKPAGGKKKAAKSAAEEAEELEGMSNSRLGKQRFRSALEQVSVYTNDAAFRARE